MRDELTSELAGELASAPPLASSSAPHSALSPAQLQEVTSTEEGLVMSFYRFGKTPRLSYLVFDLDPLYPFLGFFYHNPWVKLKKTKPVALFLNAHAKNHYFHSIEISEELGRIVKLHLDNGCLIEFRLIPKQVNLIVKKSEQKKHKSISWNPVKELSRNNLQYTQNSDEEVRSITFMRDQWLRLRGNQFQTEASTTTNSPFEKWKKNKEKDLQKKQKALIAVAEQIQKFKNEEWASVGEFLKTQGLKNLKPEWSVYVDFEKSVSDNMQNCFAKSKAAKIKVKGAELRLETLKQEVKELLQLIDPKQLQQNYEQSLHLKNLNPNFKKNNGLVRRLEGRLRKTQIIESGLVAYMGKSAADNMSLLRQAKPHDLWLHLKDYPSAHAIIHKQKDQKVSDLDIKKIASWLAKEGISAKKNQIKTQGGAKLAVVLTECRYVKPLKGDKLGRVTYHNAREILIAL